MLPQAGRTHGTTLSWEMEPTGWAGLSEAWLPVKVPLSSAMAYLDTILLPSQAPGWILE